VLRPGADERRANPRSVPAKLRWAVKPVFIQGTRIWIPPQKLKSNKFIAENEIDTPPHWKA
jgi:hypothetical protein